MKIRKFLGLIVEEPRRYENRPAHRINPFGPTERCAICKRQRPLRIAADVQNWWATNSKGNYVKHLTMVTLILR